MITSSVQECSRKRTTIVMPVWWSVCFAKICPRILIPLLMTVPVNMKVISIPEGRSIRWAMHYSTSCNTRVLSLWQFDWCPSWLVYQ